MKYYHLFLAMIVFTISNFATALPLTEKRFFVDQMKARFSVDYYATDANFDSSGNNSYILPDSNSLENISGKLFLRWVPHPQWGLWSEFSGAQTTSYNNSDGSTTRVNRGLESITLGGDLFLLKKPFRLVGDLSFTYPLQKVSLNITEQDEALLGEGATEITGQLLAHHPIGRRWRIYESVGFKYRDEQRASLAMWLIGTQWRLKWRLKRLHLSVDLYGSFPLIRDSAFDGNRKLITDKVNAGSFKFFSEDPSIALYSINGSFFFNKRFALRSSFYQEIIGSNHSKGFGVVTSLEYLYQIRKRKVPLKNSTVDKVFKKLKRKKEKEREMMKDFEEDITIENYDDSLFNDDL